MGKLAKLFDNYEDNLEPMDCERTGGPLPEWLSGTMLRNGPGLFKAGDSEYNHWFDGQAYIQRYHFRDGKMQFSARFLQTDVYKKIKETNRIVLSSFGTFRYPDPCKSLYERVMTFFESEPISDNCLVAFSQVGDEVYALTELPKMVRVDLDTLDNKGTENLADYVSVNTATAHHQGDFEGNVYNIGSKFGKGGHYVCTKTINPKNIKGAANGSFEGTSLAGTFPHTDIWAPAYLHSFGMSENFFVIMECPVRLSTKMLMVRNLMHYTYRDALYWKEDTDVNVLLMDKRTGKPHTIKYTHPPFFTFHHANTFEEDDYLVADYCWMKNPGDFDDLQLEHMRDGSFQSRNPDFKPFLHRMVLPLRIPEGAKAGDNLVKNCKYAVRGASAILQEDGSVKCQDVRLSDVSFEFPRYNWETKNTLPYRFVYGSTLLFNSDDGKSDLDGIVKVDTETRKTITWKRDHSEQLCAEPIFVPQPGSKKEDGGVLLVPVITVKEGEKPFVVVMDAANLQEISRFHIPIDRLPTGFHAHFVQRNFL